MKIVSTLILGLVIAGLGWATGFYCGRAYQIGYYEELQRLRYLTEDMAFFSLSEDLTRIQQTIDQNLINQQYDIDMSDESVR